MKTFSALSAITAITPFLASLVTAQSQYRIDPSSVDDDTKDFWCEQQRAQCPKICSQNPPNLEQTLDNDCDPTNLRYACVCLDGQSPNASEYSQTLPYFICTEWGQQCVSNCNADTACASSCLEDNPCGAQDPTRQNTSTLTRTTTSSATADRDDAAATTDGGGNVVYTGFAGAAPPTSAGDDGDTGAASAMTRVWAFSGAQTFGSVFVFGALTLGFAVWL